MTATAPPKVKKTPKAKDAPKVTQATTTFKMQPRSTKTEWVESGLKRLCPIPSDIPAIGQDAAIRERDGYVQYLSCTEDIIFGEDVPAIWAKWWRLNKAERYADAWLVFCEISPPDKIGFVNAWVNALETVETPGRADFLATQMLGEADSLAHSNSD